MGFTKDNPPRDDAPIYHNGLRAAVLNVIDSNYRINADGLYAELADHEPADIKDAVFALLDSKKIAVVWYDRHTHDPVEPDRFDNTDIYEPRYEIAHEHKVNRRVYDPNRPRAKPKHNPESGDEFSEAEFELLFALQKIEHRQQQLNQANHELKMLLNDEPKLATIWKKFESNGGTSTEQLVQFLRGAMRPRATRRMGNLRLISDRGQQGKITHKRVQQYNDDDGPNAA